MTRFRFVARDPQGQIVSGALRAASATAVESELKRRGLHVECVMQLPRELSQRQSTELMRHVALLAASELSLVEGLRAAAIDERQTELRVAMLEIAADLERGVPLEIAMAARGDMPGFAMALLATGNDPFRDMERLFEIRAVIDRLRRRVRSAFIYPGFLLVAAVSVLFFFAHVVGPSLKGMTDFGFGEVTQPPGLIFLELLRQFTAPILLAATCLAAVAFWLGRFALGDAILMRLPGVGRGRYYAAWTESSYLLALLTKRGFPLPRALQVAAAASASPATGLALEQVQLYVTAGDSLGVALEREQFCPSTLVVLAGWGETHGAVDAGFEAAGDLFAARAAVQSDLIRFAGPLIAVLIVGWLALVLASSLLAAVQFITDLSFITNLSG